METTTLTVCVCDRNTWKETKVEEGATYADVLENLNYPKAEQAPLKLWSFAGRHLPLDTAVAPYIPVMLQHPDEGPVVT